VTHTCPSCGARFSRSDTYCPSCNYGYKMLDDYHRPRHNQDLSSPLVNDTTKTLSKPALRKIQSHLKSFHLSFPNLFFAVYMESNAEKATTKGLWLLNNMTFIDHYNEVPSQQGLLLYIDPKQSSAALTYGLSLSQYISLTDANSFLQPSVSYFSEGLYPEAVKTIIEKTSQFLISKCPNG